MKESENSEMALINAVLAQIREHRHSKSSELLAQALWSACTMDSGPSLLAVSANLDEKNARLFARLARITDEPDYSNLAQSSAFHELQEMMGYGKTYHDVELNTHGRRIEVYAVDSPGPGQIHFEWRLLERGQVEHDSKDLRYRNPDIALRDALLHVYGLPRDLDQALLDRPNGRRSVELAS